MYIWVVTSRRTALRQVLHRATGAMTAQQVADEVGWPVETTRLYLEELVGAQLAERVPGAPRGRGRPPMTYRATTSMDPTGPTRYRLLAGLLARTLRAEPNGRALARAAGQAWASEQPTAAIDGAPLTRATTALTSRFEAHEFAPTATLTGDRADITLWHCPFLDLITDYGDVICSLHDGMVDGITRVTAGTSVAAQLTPFPRPDSCQITLTRRTRREN
ncbi:helix-turn-helix transcriptional regulator [Salinispora mooreana]|uniref:helix-turn-helix transcriptional regulator n=1 Tax=Salinispora mooreana TaxID=999545 RepID=UPI000476EDCA|nr:transcriptional regulator [Salinispora mooreana]